ncbi:BLUF domain-containing protein (plasmid) [Skermanella mucosa]|uniref:BLUF domain-containing protein n=1 Tax=Skermanella mucosa TaxID=1789672 RepID=UPI00192C4CBF|nr:BLUF domain-containing protein [Skermanella mucosa]UEM24727.1 BLUF domain-containing protein [Skermanella mucosa]
MSEQIHRLVYFSRNAMPGTDGEIVAGVQQILASSRRNNARAGVTGALLFNSGCFAQVLEGPSPAVTETFERIQWDERHSEVLVLEYAAVAARLFPNWSMSFVGADRSDQQLFGDVSAKSGFNPIHLKADRIFATLDRLMREEEKQAASPEPAGR